MISVIPLDTMPSPLPFNFSIQVDFEGQIFALVFDWNDRAAQWHCSLYSANETTPIEIGAILEPGFPIFLRTLPGFVQPASATPLAGVLSDLAAMTLYYFDSVEKASA